MVTAMTDRVLDYVQTVGLRESESLQQLRQKTQTLGAASAMQSSPEQGQFMAMLVQVCGFKKLLEIGTFTGYSALSCAEALPSDGTLIACDVSDEWTSIGKPYWEQSGVAHKIDLRIASATDTLNQLLADGQQNTFDMAFIDADKLGYDQYYELSLQLIRTNGVILIDNVLWSGQVADPAYDDPDTVALRELNQKLKTDERIDLVMLPIRDGLTMCRKR